MMLTAYRLAGGRTRYKFLMRYEVAVDGGTLVGDHHGEGIPALLPPRSATETAALTPGVLVATMRDCGHFPWVDRPGEFRAAVERLLARL
jgi:pimeloyl-ACP methyl ester carboxylesterase